MIPSFPVRGTLRARILLIVCTLSFVVVFNPGSASATSLGVNPTFKSVSVGDIFTLDVNVTGVVDLFSYAFDLRFDPTILAETGVIDGGLLTNGGGVSAFAGPIDVPDNVHGVVRVLDLLLGPVPLLAPATGGTGNGILATIGFVARAPGISPITFQNITLQNEVQALSLDPANNFMKNVGAGRGTVEVLAPVPEPGTFLLVLSGITFQLKRQLQNRRGSKR